ncbi:MAG: hypothetical protein AB7P37_21260 [Ramlibacter sp.]
MSSKRAIRRRLQRKACQGKVRHANEAGANVALRKLRRTGTTDGVMQAYACRFCGGWHIGHVPGTGRAL